MITTARPMSHDPLERIRELQPLIQSKDADAIRAILAKLHEMDMVEIFERFSKSDVVFCFNQIEGAVRRANVFGELSFPYQSYIVRVLSVDESRYILETLPIDELQRFFHQLPRTKAQKIKETLKAERFEALKQHQERYPHDQIGHWINDDYFAVTPDSTVEMALATIRERSSRHEPIYNIYVVNDEQQLLDKFSLEVLVAATPETRISDLMDFKVARLEATDSVDYALERFRTRDSVSLPVVDENGGMIGVIRADDMVHLAQESTTRTYQKMAAVEAMEKPYIQTTYWESFKQRGVWLLVLFIGEMFTATAMGYYEDEISHAVVLALFLPLILSSGGNSGSQSSTLVIRALALKEFELHEWPKIFKRELIVGFMLAMLLGVFAVARILLWDVLGWADYTEKGQFDIYSITLAVTIGIMGIVTWGNLVGSLLPIGLRYLKLDPATISAPFLATFVDVTGLIIYFTAAKIILGL